MKLLKILLIINFPFYLFFAVSYFFWPEKMGAYFDIHLASPTAIADFRATYAGLPIAFCVLILLGIRYENWRLQSFALVLATTAGLLIGRGYTMVNLWVQEQSFKPVIPFFAAVELGATLIESYILIKLLKRNTV